MAVKKKKIKNTPSDTGVDQDEAHNAAEEEPQVQEKGHVSKQGSSSKGKGKGKKGQPKLSKAVDDPLAKEVVAMILKGIAEPESQKDGKAFVPSDWSMKFKPKLGPYKKFLLAHPDEFALVEDGTGNFIIKRPQDVDPNEKTKAPLVKGTTWQKKLLDAWLAYCLIVPRSDRDLNAFLAPLPRGAREGKLGEDAPAERSTSEKGGESASEPNGKRKKNTEAEETPPAKVPKKKKKTKEVAAA